MEPAVAEPTRGRELRPYQTLGFQGKGEDGSLATDLFVYINDGQVVALSEMLCWQAARYTRSSLNHLGIS